jgi:hypothetical protein
MALPSCPARQGQQRSLRRMRRVLSWALARSPGDRGWAYARLASFCEAGLPLHPTSPGQAHDQVRLTGQLGRLNTDYWQAEPRRKPAAGEGQVTGEYASGEILGEDQDGTLGSRFPYVFWRLREQRIATQQSAEPSHSARVTAARARVSPHLRIVALRRATSPGQSAGQAGTPVAPPLCGAHAQSPAMVPQPAAAQGALPRALVMGDKNKPLLGGDVVRGLIR